MLQGLNSQLLRHLSFMSLQLDKKRLLLKMIFASLKILELFEKFIAKHSKDNYSIPLIKKQFDA